MAVTNETWDRVLERDNFTCVYCDFDGRSFDRWRQLTCDHVIRQCQNGVDDIDNLVVACANCNNLTSTFDVDPTLSRTAQVQQKRQFILQKLCDLRNERWNRISNMIRPSISEND